MSELQDLIDNLPELEMIISESDYLNKYKDLYTNVMLKTSPDRKGEVYNFGIEYSNNKAKTAIIWINGFHDFFYHYHVDERINENDPKYDIFSITLRRYGNPDEFDYDPKFRYYSDDLTEYYDEVKQTIDYIKSKEQYDKIILYGFSMGGLVALSFMTDDKNSNYISKINSLVLNCPFVDLFQPSLLEFFGKYIISPLGAIFPKLKGSSGNPEKININKTILRKRIYLDPKKYLTPGTSDVFAGWLRTNKKMGRKIRKIKSDTKLNIPILVMYSDKSILDPTDDNDNFAKADYRLDVEDIDKFLEKFYEINEIEPVIIEDSMHDVFASYYDEPMNKAIDTLKSFLEDNNQ